MQKILIPTDFSPGADNAMNYAIEIAAKFKSELLLYHVYSYSIRSDYDSDFPEDEQPYVKRIEQKMNITKNKFTKRIKEKGLSLETKIEDAYVFSLFSDIVTDNKITLIVMGSKGASGLQKIVFGSVAATALELAKVPVLIVPPENSHLSFDHILLAVDQKGFSTRTISSVEELAFEFGAKLTSLYVNDGSNEDQHSNVNLHFKKLKVSYREIPKSKSINDSINEFLRDGNYDLLCMIRREKGFFKSLFHKSITKAQVYSVGTPLLILPES